MKGARRKTAKIFDTFIISQESFRSEMSQDSRPFNNNGLFSNHYLENLIQSALEWNQDSQLEGAFTEIKNLFHRREKQLENYIESDLEHNFIRPIFDILGHYYGIQETVYGTALKPDYSFFPTRRHTKRLIQERRIRSFTAVLWP